MWSFYDLLSSRVKKKTLKTADYALKDCFVNHVNPSNHNSRKKKTISATCEELDTFHS